jgi:hypothetical protein
MLLLKRSLLIFLIACLPLAMFSGCEVAASYLLYDLISGGPIFGDGDGDDDDDNGDLNHNPEITTIQALPNSVSIGGIITLTCIATDEDDDPVSYLWQASKGEFQDETDNITLWTAPNNNTGIFQIMCSVSDGQGGSDIGSVEVEVTL